jgi:hypothetical protein
VGSIDWLGPVVSPKPFIRVIARVVAREYWENVADNLSKAGWSWGCVSTINSNGQTIFVADAHHDEGKRFIVAADEKLSAFVELERQVLTVTFYLESSQ